VLVVVVEEGACEIVQDVRERESENNKIKKGNNMILLKVATVDFHLGGV
jgi:hypothetical protein